MEGNLEKYVTDKAFQEWLQFRVTPEQLSEMFRYASELNAYFVPQYGFDTSILNEMARSSVIRVRDIIYKDKNFQKKNSYYDQQFISGVLDYMEFYLSEIEIKTSKNVANQYSHSHTDLKTEFRREDTVLPDDALEPSAPVSKISIESEETFTEDMINWYQGNKIEYTITYDPGTKGTFDAKNFDGNHYGEPTPGFDGEPTGEDGWIFTGWNPEPGDTVTRNVTYSAQWKQIKCTVTNDSDVDEPIEAETHDENHSSVYELNQPEEDKKDETKSKLIEKKLFNKDDFIRYLIKMNYSSYDITYICDKLKLLVDDAQKIDEITRTDFDEKKSEARITISYLKSTIQKSYWERPEIRSVSNLLLDFFDYVEKREILSKTDDTKKTNKEKPDNKSFQVEKKDDERKYEDIKNEPSVSLQKLGVSKVNVISTPRKEREKKLNSIPFYIPGYVLYIFKGTISCRRKRHNIIPATGFLKSLDGKYIKINVNCCDSCNQYFISLDEYRHYQKIHGALLGNYKFPEYKSSSDERINNLADESPLHWCGYNVSKEANLSKEKRRLILKNIIENNTMDKDRIMAYLKFFIQFNKNQRNKQEAVQKWKDDLDWIRNFQINEQRRFLIREIRRK